MTRLRPASPPRHRSQRGSVSAKRDQLLREYEEGAVLHLAPITVGGYLKQMRAVLRWLDEKGIDLASVRLSDLLSHLSELGTARKKDGNPYSAGQQQKRVSALKSFFRFLVRRGCASGSGRAAGDAEERVPPAADHLTKDEAQRIIEVARGRARASCATARSWRRSTQRDPRCEAHRAHAPGRRPGADAARRARERRKGAWCR